MRARDAFRIDSLSVVYETDQGVLPAVRGVSLALAPREAVGLVGESGSGKTTLALGAIGYLPPGGRVVSGSAALRETELMALSRRQMQNVWGSRIGLVSQNPQAALNPALTIGRQLDETARRHLHLGRRAARDLTLAMLRRVDMPDPKSVVRRYPHQLSGGMLQRSAIAMALLTNPELLILDEPTTALDATTQAMVLDLLDELKAEFNSAILYITHNLGVVSRICNRVAIMYAGEIFEEAKTADLFAQPLHPYTLNLLNCVPRFEIRGVPAVPGSDRRLATIPGSLPRPHDLPAGCIFAPRCSLALDMCRASRPPLVVVGDGRSTSCLRWEVLRSDSGREAAIAEDSGAAGGTASTGVETPATARSPDLYPVDRPQAGGHLLEAHDIVKVFSRPGAKTGLRALDGVSVWIDQGTTLGLVGESGSGKTTLARALTGLSAPSGGQISMDGNALGRVTADRSKKELGRLQMVFQNPEASLNPRRTVGQAVMRPLLTLWKLDRPTATARAYELLEAVRLPALYFYRFPGELSGGEKQRVAIARAFAATPDLVVCDEPISSLDVSVQGSIMNLLVDLQGERQTAYLFISHDVAVVQHLSHRVAVMYLGLVVEEGKADRVLGPPYHPYTEALFSAVPVPDPSKGRTRTRLRPGGGDEIPSGCRFHPRCPRFLGAVCRDLEPPWRTVAGQAGAKSGLDAPNRTLAPRETSGPNAFSFADHAIRCHIPLERLVALQVGTLPERG